MTLRERETGVVLILRAEAQVAERGERILSQRAARRVFESSESLGSRGGRVAKVLVAGRRRRRGLRRIDGGSARFADIELRREGAGVARGSVQLRQSLAARLILLSLRALNSCASDANSLALRFSCSNGLVERDRAELLRLAPVPQPALWRPRERPGSRQRRVGFRPRCGHCFDSWLKALFRLKVVSFVSIACSSFGGTRFRRRGHAEGAPYTCAPPCPRAAGTLQASSRVPSRRRRSLP